jgi:hypothetical protein
MSDEWTDGKGGWSIDWHGLDPASRWLWFEQLWVDACALRQRYLLPLRSGWWESAVVVEALQALAAWVADYDSGELDDPAGKLALLFELDRIGELLRDGSDPFQPERDRDGFVAFMFAAGCEPPDFDPRPPGTEGA